MEYPTFKVYVRCFTFNQSNYILDALNGFVMQQTSFPFLCCIVDDASTDNEPEVIKNFLMEEFDDCTLSSRETDDYTMTLARHKYNTNCYFAVFFLKYNHYGWKDKLSYFQDLTQNTLYTAYCEGDDFWTDKEKLQIQVDFMDSHPLHSMCYHPTLFLYPDGNTEERRNYHCNVESCDVNDYILHGFGHIRINTFLFRNSMYPGYSWTVNPPVGDGPMCLTLFETGKVAYLNRLMTCTRYDSVGSWHSSMKGKLKKQFLHHKKTKRIWKDYDKWSHYRHHKFVMRKIRINNKNFVMRILTQLIERMRHIH